MGNAHNFDAKISEENIDTGISENKIEALTEHLSRALADSYVLYLQTQGVHWNGVGPAFYSVHKLTEEQYEDLADAIDEIAERIRALGQTAPSSFGEFAEISVLESEPQKENVGAMLERLIDSNQAVASRLREAVEAAEEVKDVFTADMLTARIGVHEQAAWMLRSLNA